ncbi:DUF3084 domain-containing protein [Synechococcus sp. PCC 6312]|uniref:DUF3084 domain-containing protein n=1 Tax=Synechococcus sp. (strain ATCC 27167 / PCC 6312) TaxID=195253 RepID=UPI00029F091E|nr:DUF3084 domain-containing protein [Synechococcus sp. PCC 6312]AFY59264.1 hypothetical protein Syn6312_0004 [Synechococcus sp. PCC 6312]
MVGYVLILAVIILGGAIATVGDRLGSKVGKARLSLFNLRPKQTAVLITILTGSLIAGSTLGILFAVSKELRDAVFRIESIQRQRQAAEVELKTALIQKNSIESDLAASQANLSQVKTQLAGATKSLKAALTRQAQTQRLFEQLQARYRQTQANLIQVQAKSRTLQTEITRLQAEQTTALRQLQTAQGQRQELEIAVTKIQTRLAAAERQKQTLEDSIATIQTQLATADQQRQALLDQQTKLRSEIKTLETSRQRLEENVEVLLLGLRRGTISIRAGQVLAAGVVKNIDTPTKAQQAIEEFLRQARRNAIILNSPQNIKPTDQVIQVTTADIERLMQQLLTGKTYSVRILAAANYLQGEANILVVPQAAENSLIFEPGATIARINLSPSKMSDEQILQRLDALFTTSNQRAIEAGVWPDPVSGTVGAFDQIELVKFILALRNYPGDIEISSIVPQAIYTSGPMKLELVARQNQKIILRGG